MPTFTKDQVQHLGWLVRIALNDEEADKLKDDMNVISEAINSIQEVATQDVEPTANPIPLEAHLREDLPATPFTQEEAIAGAPKADSGMFVAPQILGGEESE